MYEPVGATRVVVPMDCFFIFAATLWECTQPVVSGCESRGLSVSGNSECSEEGIA